MKKKIFFSIFFLLVLSRMYSFPIPSPFNFDFKPIGMLQYEDDGEGPPVEDPPPPAPIDDWIPYLMIVGVFYTGVKLIQKNKLKKTND
jgi:hypothetical protein